MSSPWIISITPGCQSLAEKLHLLLRLNFMVKALITLEMMTLKLKFKFLSRTISF